MGSDTMPGTAVTPGDNFSININCESLDEIERLFAALGEGGRVTIPLENTFWNARFGMLRDRFGVNWMFNYELTAER
jgi:PhnB protein